MAWMPRGSSIAVFAIVCNTSIGLIVSSVSLSATLTRSVTAQLVTPTARHNVIAATPVSCLNWVSPSIGPKTLRKSIAPAPYPISEPTATMRLAQLLPCCCFDIGNVSTINPLQLPCTALIAKSMPYMLSTATTIVWLFALVSSFTK
jgi:hypothetical protein